MWKPWPVDNMPLLARVLYFIGGFLSFVSLAVNGIIEALYRHPLFATLWILLVECIAFLAWGIAFLITSVELQRREPQPSLFMQPLLWFGLMFLALIPDGFMLALLDSRVLSEGPVTEAITLCSVIAVLFCLVLAVFFWWRKRRPVAH